MAQDSEPLGDRRGAHDEEEDHGGNEQARQADEMLSVFEEMSHRDSRGVVAECRGAIKGRFGPSRS
jgi:hypothetical protein